MAITNVLSQARQGFYGWRIVGLMLGPRAAGVGVYIFGNTLFVIPLEQELGIPRTVSSLLFALGALTSGLSAPISGMLMDRFGPRRVLIVSVVLSSVGYALFAAANNVVVVFIVFLGPISLTILNVAFNASSGLINNWFDRQKGLAFSALQAGAGIGSFIILPVLAFSIEQWSWRVAALVACGMVLVLGLPAAWMSRDNPEEMGLLPDGDTPQPRPFGGLRAGPLPQGEREQASPLRQGMKDPSGPLPQGERGQPHGQAPQAPFVMTGASVGEALRTPSFWMLAVAVLFVGGGTIGVQVHFVPIMVWKGVNEVQAGLMLTAMAVSGIPLVLVMGWAADRFDRLVVGSAVCLTVGLGVLLMNAVAGPALWVAVVFFAANMGIWPIAWAVVGQMFGRRAYSTIRGYLMAGQIVITAAIPVLYGLLYDDTASYTLALWVAFAMWLGGALIMLTTPRRTYGA